MSDDIPAQRLGEMEVQYRSIFEAAGEGMIIATLQGVVVEANPAACRMFGYTRDALLGLHAGTLIHSADLHLITESARVARAGDSALRQAVGLHKDGTLFNTEGRVTGLSFQGEPHVLVVVRDITERVQAEEQLREKEEQYRDIFETTTDGLVLVNMDGTIVEVNPAFSDLTGYSRDELIGRAAVTLMHPDDEHQVLEGMWTIHEEGHGRQKPACLLRSDGTLLHVERHGTPVLFKGKPHTLGVMRDITERVQAEQELRKREAEYRSVFESTSDGLIIGDSDGKVVEVNPAACRLYGYAHDEFLGLAVSTLIHPDDRHRGVEHSRAIEAGDTIHIAEIGLHKDGTPFHAEVRGTRFMYQGQPMRLAIVRDITERVRAYELLEQRVEERTRELSTLLDVSHNVASILDLERLLDLILEQLQSAVDYVGAGIVVREGDEVRIVRQRGPEPYAISPETGIPLSEARTLWNLIALGRGVIIDDVRGETEPAQAYRELVGSFLEEYPYIRAWMAVPMRVKDREIGALFLAHSESDAFNSHHSNLALAVAQQAAIAIENARLYQQAQEMAVLDERQRLSRELHDSVSQALYGITLGAQTARRLAEREPTQIIAPLDYVLSLAQTGLDEMRALIFELRPETLEQEGLVEVLQKQADAITARHPVRVTTSLCDEPVTPLPTKEALYRIAQEALHNSVNHAEAAAIRVSLQRADEHVILAIQDNGKGFDTTGSFPGHFGLHSMRERAERASGILEIESQVGVGTTITVRIPVQSTPQAPHLTEA